MFAANRESTLFTTRSGSFVETTTAAARPQG
jgi:hypothetical protein